MANCSIPNSIPATGRISIPSSPQSKRPNKRQSASDFQRFQFFSVSIFPFPESEGCLVVLAVFKTVVGSQEPGQVRFLSSPPKSSIKLKPQTFLKGGESC